MITLTPGLRLAFGALALLLLFGVASSAYAQGKDRISITRQDDPLTRDPRHPTAYEVDVEQQSAVLGKEVERALRDGNEATDAKPPRYDDAERYYQEALKLNPKEARAYLGLGRLYAAKNDADGSINAFKKAIELKPKLAEAHFNLGAIYNALGKKDAALEQYHALQGLNRELAQRLNDLINK